MTQDLAYNLNRVISANLVAK